MQPTRGRPRSPAADEAIAEATLAILTERGYRELTMAGVAERAGVSTATLYRRWTSKQDLVVGIVATTLVPDRDPVDTGTLAGDLTEILNRSVDRLNGEVGQLIKGIIGETVRNPDLSEALRRTVLDPRLEEITDVLERAVRRGEIPPVTDHRLAINMILGPINYRFLITEDPLTTDVVERLVPLLLRALGCLPCGDAG